MAEDKYAWPGVLRKLLCEDCDRSVAISGVRCPRCATKYIAKLEAEKTVLLEALREVTPDTPCDHFGDTHCVSHVQRLPCQVAIAQQFLKAKP